MNDRRKRNMIEYEVFHNILENSYYNIISFVFSSLNEKVWWMRKKMVE